MEGIDPASDALESARQVERTSLKKLRPIGGIDQSARNFNEDGGGHRFPHRAECATDAEGGRKAGFEMQIAGGVFAGQGDERLQIHEGQAAMFTPVVPERVEVDVTESGNGRRREFELMVPGLDGGADLGAGLNIGLYVARGEPREEPNEIVGDQDLPIAVRAGSDADGRDGDRPGDLLGNRRDDEFEDDGEGAGIGEGTGIQEKILVLGVRPTFHMVTAFVEDVLGEHAEVTEERDSVREDGAN